LNKKRTIALSGLIFLAAAVAFFRVWRWIVHSGLFFFSFHLFFILSLVVFSVWLAFRIRQWDNQPSAGPDNINLIEIAAMGGTAAIFFFAFLLSGWTQVRSGRSSPDLVPFFQGINCLTQSVVAGFAFSILALALHLIMRRTVPYRDPWLVPLALTLSGTGLLLLFQLGPEIARVRKIAAFERLFELQFRSLILSSFILIFSIRFFSISRLESLTRKRYGYVLLSVFLIAVTAIFGIEAHGRRLSLHLGIMRFQTVELVKVLALFFMVGYFRYEKGVLEAGKGWMGLPRGRYLIPYLMLWILTLLPIFLQKDLGPTALLFALFLLVFYIGTGSGISVFSGIAIMLLAGLFFYWIGVPTMVKTRVNMWLDPFFHSQNMAEAMWAFGSGGWFGVGMSESYSYHIPVVQSDFNFAALAESWGLVGVGCVIGWFVMLVQRTVRLSLAATFPYQQMLLVGLGALWGIQTFIIVGGNLGLLPLTGITLPFISYGGSSLLVNFLILGIVVRMSGEMDKNR
jgi:cell division protein FtsW (lipid II flippase)